MKIREGGRSSENKGQGEILQVGFEVRLYVDSPAAFLQMAFLSLLLLVSPQLSCTASSFLEAHSSLTQQPITHLKSSPPFWQLNILNYCLKFQP